MSKTFSIGCLDCKLHLWIGQGHDGSISVYSGEPETMNAFVLFLQEHTDHNLVILDNANDQRMDDMVAIRPQDHPVWLSLAENVTIKGCQDE